MSNKLAVIFDGTLMGTLDLNTRGGALSFTYDASYLDRPDATPLSASMPLGTRPYGNRLVTSWLRNLLPDNRDVLERWGQLFGVSANSPFRLMEHVGRDVAGAAQFVPWDGITPLNTRKLRAGSVKWLTDGELIERLAELRSDPAAWTPQMQAGLFSLAGAQAKIALRRDLKGNRWGLPYRAAATTHILKPYNDHLPNHALNEHLTLNLASELGLIAARSELTEIGGFAVLIVERYDRFPERSVIRRVHQEDMCQALGLPPTAKYETDGGPGAARIIKMLQRLSGPQAQGDIDRFIQALAFAWATAGTDAHAKNYSILLSGASVRLGPLYDLQSAAPYFTDERRAIPRGRISVHTASMAMRVGRHRRFGEVTQNDWRQLASEVGLPDEHVLDLVRAVVHELPEALDRIATAIGSGAEPGMTSAKFVPSYVRALKRHARAMGNLLEGRRAYGRS